MAASGPDAGKVSSYFARQAAGYFEDSVRRPWSWLRAREAEAVIGLLGDLEGADVLELGCGAGYYTRVLLDRGARHVFATDIVPDMVLQLPRQDVTAVVADAASVSLDRRFRHILIAGLLEFVSSPNEVFANALHHAEPGATFVVLAPAPNIWGGLYCLFHRRHGIAVRLFDPAGLAALADETGWRPAQSVRVWPFSLVVKLHPAG